MATGTVIGVDLGGTKIDAGRYDAGTWKLQTGKRIDTRVEGRFAQVLEDMVGLINELRMPDTVAVGVGVPGPVHQPEGTVLTFPNIPGGDHWPLQKELNERLGIPVLVNNDANCFTLAETWEGAGKGHPVVIGVTMGTGVGGGIVINGKIFHGSQGFAAEIGHMLLVPGQPPYQTEDKRGEIEQFFSGTAMGKRCEEATDPDDYLDGKVCAFMQPSIFREVAWMCVNLMHLLDPSVIVFGGSAGHALTPHLPKVREEIRHWALPGTPLPELAVAKLKDAAMLGAALLHHP